MGRDNKTKVHYQAPTSTAEPVLQVMKILLQLPYIFNCTFVGSLSILTSFHGSGRRSTMAEVVRSRFILIEMQ